MSPFLKSCWGNPATPVGTRVWGPCHTARLEPSGCLLLIRLASSFIDLSLGSRMVSVGVTAAEQVWAGWGDLAIFGKLGEVYLPHKAIILLSPVMASPGSTRRGIFELSNSLLWVWGGFLPLFLTNSYLKGIGRLWCDGDSYLYSVSKRGCNWNGSTCGCSTYASWALNGKCHRRETNPQTFAISVFCAWTCWCADIYLFS